MKAETISGTGTFGNSAATNPIMEDTPMKKIFIPDQLCHCRSQGRQQVHKMTLTAQSKAHQTTPVHYGIRASVDAMRQWLLQLV